VARRQAVELEGERLTRAGLCFEQFWNGSPRVRCWSLGQQLTSRRLDVATHRSVPLISVALDVAERVRGLGRRHWPALGYRLEGREQACVLGLLATLAKARFRHGFNGNAQFLADRVVDVGAQASPACSGFFATIPQGQHDLLSDKP